MPASHLWFGTEPSLSVENFRNYGNNCQSPPVVARSVTSDLLFTQKLRDTVGRDNVVPFLIRTKRKRFLQVNHMSFIYMITTVLYKTSNSHRDFVYKQRFVHVFLRILLQTFEVLEGISAQVMDICTRKTLQLDDWF